jgi:dihydrolipoamide dehydrogenase
MATILAKLGCQVTIVEMLPHILPLEDAELTSVLGRALKEDGVQLYEGSKVSRIEDSEGGKTATVTTGDMEKKLQAEVVAIAVGYCPNVDNLGLNEAGVKVSKGGIQVNEHMQTSVPGIFAAGDAIGGIMLAYVAMEEGIVAAENTLGKNSAIDYQAVPKCTFTLPELASVGLTETEAVARGHQVKVGRFPFSANSMATILGERRGLVKIITEAKYGQILEATPQDIVATIHAHPTLSEALREAALDVTGETIHFPSKNKR